MLSIRSYGILRGYWAVPGRWTPSFVVGLLGDSDAIPRNFHPSREKNTVMMLWLVHEQSASEGGGCRWYLFIVYPVASAIRNKPREGSGNSGHHVRAHPFTRANLWIARPIPFMRPDFRHSVAQWLRPQTSPVRATAQCCFFVTALLPLV